MSSSVVSMFAIICIIQLGALFALAFAESFLAVRRSLLAAVIGADPRSETKVLPLERAADIADQPRYTVAS